MIKEAEDIILNKQYFELSPSEKELVGEYVKTEEDFEEMKWFLKGAQTVFVEDQVEPSADLKKNVFAHLHQDAGQKRIWLNSVGVFLFPTGKKVYQYPALQIAAVAILAFGITFMIPESLNDQEIALNDTVLVENEIEEIPENETTIALSQDSADYPGEVDTRAMIDEKSLEELDKVVEGEVLREEIGGGDITIDNLGSTDPISELAEMEGPLPSTIEDEISSDEDLDNFYAMDSVSTGYADDGVDVADAEAYKMETYKKEKLKKEKATNGVTNTPSTNTVDTSESEDITYNTSQAGGAYEDNYQGDERKTDKDSNIITIPTSLHINQTKELKSLFYTIK